MYGRRDVLLWRAVCNMQHAACNTHLPNWSCTQQASCCDTRHSAFGVRHATCTVHLRNLLSSSRSPSSTSIWRIGRMTSSMIRFGGMSSLSSFAACLLAPRAPQRGRRWAGTRGGAAWSQALASGSDSRQFDLLQQENKSVSRKSKRFIHAVRT